MRQNRGQAELAAGAHDAHRDLAPIGDEELSNHPGLAHQHAAVHVEHLPGHVGGRGIGCEERNGFGHVFGDARPVPSGTSSEEPVFACSGTSPQMSVRM